MGLSGVDFGLIRVIRDLTQQDGCKTQDGRMTKKIRARPGMHSLAPHFFVILPFWVLQPSCCVSSLLARSDDREEGVQFINHKYDYRRHDVLLPINHNYDKIRETNKASIERWTILKSRYECWKTQQFIQQSAPQQRAQNGAYCPVTSMTCATVQ